RHASLFLAPMALMPLFGLWYLATMPADSRSWAMGGSVIMTAFLTVGVGASLLIGLYAGLALLWKKLYINGMTAALLCVLAGVATAGGEFVREGTRKPYTVRNELYSYALTEDEVAHLRRV